MLTDQPDLFAWPAAQTTSGPRPTSADGERKARDYAAEWARFVELRPDIAAWILTEARAAVAAGRTRVAVATLVEAARVKFGATINNSWRAPAADWLVATAPTLDAVIERRARKAAP